MRTIQPASSGSTLGAVRVIGPWTIYFRKWQDISLTADSGTLTVDYDGDITAPIAFDADAATIQAALIAAVPALDGLVDVTGGPFNGGLVHFTFDDSLGDVPLLIVDGTGLVNPVTDVFITQAELGTEIYTPAIGDLVLDLFLQRVEANPGRVYLADTIDGGGDYATGEITLGEVVEVGSKFSYTSSAFHHALSQAETQAEIPTWAIDGSPLFVVLSEPGGPGITTGIVRVWLQVATPVAP